MSLIERAVAKLNPKDISGAIPTDDSVAIRSADQPVGRNGAAAPGTTATVGQRVSQSTTIAATKAEKPVVPTRKPVKLKLKGIGAQDYVRHGAKRSELIGTFRHIKRPLLANIFGHGVPIVPNGRRIMVTSALPGEGKTFTSIHLALSIAAEIDASVILVDGDIIRPSMHTVLGLDQKPGLSDWFNDKNTPVQELVCPTNINGLQVVPAGQWKPNSAEVLASRSMSQFFDALASAYPDHIILVDSPPLLPASESAIMAKNMGQVVLVVGAGVTSQAQVDQALEMLEGDQTVSLVLNRSRNSSSYANYGY